MVSFSLTTPRPPPIMIIFVDSPLWLRCWLVDALIKCIETQFKLQIQAYVRTKSPRTILGACTASPVVPNHGPAWLYATPAQMSNRQTQDKQFEITLCINDFSPFVKCIYYILGCIFNQYLAPGSVHARPSAEWQLFGAHVWGVGIQNFRTLWQPLLGGK